MADEALRRLIEVASPESGGAFGKQLITAYIGWMSEEQSRAYHQGMRDGMRLAALQRDSDGAVVLPKTPTKLVGNNPLFTFFELVKKADRSSPHDGED